MGRQIAIAATTADEEAFLGFVKSTAEIKIAESASPTIETLWVDCFSPEFVFHHQYWIWNTAFSWHPEYARVNPDAVGTAGWHYLKNSFQAPVVQFTRTDWSIPRFGRVYWAKDFAAPHGLDYDVDSFSRWFDSLVRWVRRNGKRIGGDRGDPYFLPDAMSRYSANSIDRGRTKR